MWNFAYVHASTGTDLYVGTLPSVIRRETEGKSVYIASDLAGLAADADGGNIELETSEVSGIGVRGKVKINARELDMSSIKITNLSAGENANEAVNKAQLDLKVDAALLGAVEGVATLDESGKVPASQLPSYVDDVLEYDNLAAFPSSGEVGKIYIALDTGKTYRWSGSIYVEISAGPATSDDVPEGLTNKYYTDARAKSAAVIDSMAGLETDQAPSVSSLKSYLTANSGVIFVDDLASLPAPGDAAKLYVTKDEDKLYYYKEVGAGGSGVTYEYTELSAPQPFYQEQHALTENDILNQYVDLQHLAKPKSVTAYANRLAIHLDYDFTITNVSGKSRLSFIGEIGTGGISELVPGDIIFVNYTH